MSTKSRKFDVVTGGGGGRRTAAGAVGSGLDASSRLSRIKLTDPERKRLQERIKKASSLEEIARLEKELSEGRLPAGIYAEGEAMEE